MGDINPTRGADGTASAADAVGADRDCRIAPAEAHALICEFFDSETSPERAEEIRRIVETCPQSFRWLKSEQAIRQIVRRCNCQDQAPEGLRQRIVQSISISYTEIRYE